MNKNLMRVLCAVMAAVALFAMTACGGKTTETQPATTEATTAETTVESTTGAVSTEGAVNSFYMSLGQTYEEQVYLNAYNNGDGTAYVEYAGAEKKVGNLDVTVLETIAAEMEKAGLAALNGQEVYEEGEANASLSVELSDGTYCSANFTGNIPEAFSTAFAQMEAVFQTLTADMPAYVPQAQVGEDVNEEALAAMQEILNNANLPNLDGLVISNVPVDENFGFVMGLTASEGITSGTACTPMMMTTAYSFVIVTLEDEAKAADVAADFENTMDWRKWVCVAPGNALIAQKGNMVLCLMGSEEMYTGTAEAAKNAGWTELKALENPDL